MDENSGRNILITGGTGFLGGYVKTALQSSGYICSDLKDGEEIIDVRDASRIKSFLEGLGFIPDAVMHLAAQSFVPRSFENPIETFGVNFTGTYNILNALKETGFKGLFVYISSGDIYGLIGENELPVAEEHPLRPRNPYAVSKTAAEALCFQWSVTENIKIISARPFNNIGPGQNENFVVPSFAKQITEIKLGLKEPVIYVGDIDATRDFLDVRDAAAAYALLIQNDIRGLGGQNKQGLENYNFSAYNISSGKETSLRHIINLMLEISGVKAEIKTDESRLRANEQKRICGSNEKIKKDCGWTPKITLRESIGNILKYYEEKLKT